MKPAFLLASGLLVSGLFLSSPPALAAEKYLRCDKMQFSSDTQKETALATPPITPTFLLKFDLDTKAFTFTPKIVIGEIVRADDKTIYFLDRVISIESPKWTWKILATLNRTTLVFELTYLSLTDTVYAFRHYQCKILAAPPKPKL